MAEALEQVLELFRAKQWKFEVDEENDLVHTGVEGDNGDWRVIAGASDDDRVFLMLSLLPQKCPVQKRAACAELLTRINFGMEVGCFEMDFESGRIHLKTAVPFAPGALDPGMLNKVVMFNLGCMDKFLPAIKSVIYAGTSPARVLAAVELEEKAKEQAKAKQQDKQQEAVRRRFMDN
jgi:hypothetical protein